STPGIIKRTDALLTEICGRFFFWSYLLAEIFISNVFKLYFAGTNVKRHWTIVPEFRVRDADLLSAVIQRRSHDIEVEHRLELIPVLILVRRIGTSER